MQRSAGGMTEKRDTHAGAVDQDLPGQEARLLRHHVVRDHLDQHFCESRNVAGFVD
jgi:hypothetical protein